ncbi:zinc finger CCHC domain-containing protein 17 [Gymnogyps californianus]|uniref:zinc finger CCHC domain-containing protein 17 n=1 Tax=Gymnogyps californianus TaxID=33616 RepID=UPI0021CA835F|nr:zinc finger CCHC domain-containing protein 17 [Gymnogyps californianus]XP_050765775.1 zinc finger CCHC domain-containing protein 17 [Gymnogyps californianus]XP_050765776.1 zinc finger CCHC domain-containing protein 17 [Gymnogyps californianus]
MEALPELYAIFQGEVATVTEYGAFIKIPGCRKQGLVHKTHMSSCRVDKPSEIVDVGDKVWVKLIGKEMKDDKLKLSLSMKVVNQGTGKDLDPNNVSLDQDERKKRTFRDYTSQKITLEAVLNTVCKKCGCKGHFAKECFVQPGGTKYSLIPEEEEEEVAAAAGYEKEKKTSLADDSSKKRKKEKKKKKKHKSKQSSESDSDSSDSDSDGAQPAGKRTKHSEKPSKAQKKKKKKKHKKKPRD